MAGSTSYNYNTFQQLYCLNAAANAVGRSTDTLDNLLTAMKSALDAKIPTLPGNWTVTWGPAVFKQDPNDASQGPDNAWFVAQSGQTCVVAVAGTAMKSTAGIFIDTDVDNTVDFNNWVSQWNQNGVPYATVAPKPNELNPYLAAGTCLGVANILTTKSTYASPGQFLWQYLQNLSKDTTVIFTGHSMGGALTPVLALGLQQSKLLTVSNVSVLPSAGATPGNEAFVQVYKTAFPATGSDYQGFNADFYNTNDVVPQAFSLQANDDRNFGNIQKLYGSALNWNYCDNHMVIPLEKKSGDSGMAYRPIPGSPFSAPFTPPLVILLKGVLAQHIGAYWTHIGITPFVSAFTDKLKEGGVEVITEESFEGVKFPGEAESN